FVFSGVLITSIYVLSRQLFFLQDKALVLATEQVLVIRTMDLDTAINRADAYHQWKVKTDSENFVVGTSATSAFPGDISEGSQFYNLSSDAEKKQHEFLTHQISEDYFKTMGVQLLYGRDFAGEAPGEGEKIIISERAAHELGFANVALAIGAKINLTREQKAYEVIGIAKDYMESMKLPLWGRVFIYKTFQPTLDNYYNYFLVKMSTRDMKHSIAQLESQWNTLFDNSPFDYFFLDTYFDRFYKGEQQFAGVFGIFSIIGVVVACMGLFGLSLYNTESRAKEIGIRKSLGGSVRSIMWLFSWEYLKLVIIASIVGLPVGLWVLNNWLKGYPNRIALSIDVVLVPLLITLTIAILTVGYRTYKTAYMDPVKSLRNE
ncbi:MAG TPA: FtsX-like permease family protein, partial [Cyclobacteriaceae bacterium]